MDSKFHIDNDHSEEFNASSQKPSSYDSNIYSVKKPNKLLVPLLILTSILIVGGLVYVAFHYGGKILNQSKDDVGESAANEGGSKNTSTVEPSVPKTSTRMTGIAGDTELDIEKIDRLEPLGLAFAAREINLRRGLQPNATDWNAFRDWQMSREGNCSSLNVSIRCELTMIDPYTNTPYQFTEEDPQYGEVQFKRLSCDSPNDDGTNFEPGSRKAAAIRVKLSDRFYCHLLAF